MIACLCRGEVAMAESTTVNSLVILQGIRQPDNSRAWGQFSERYEPMLLAFARRAGFREEDARDIVQETLLVFVEAFRAGKYDRDKGRLRSWLQGIAFNKIREARRRLARREVQVADGTEGTGFMHRVPDDQELTDIFDQEWERSVLAECLRQVRQQVEPHTFEAFELYALQGWSVQKVAEHLGINPDAVYVSKSRVLTRLREAQQEIAEIW
jgi:RNA polymerase sigma-70 factor (ECF subfamily)